MLLLAVELRPPNLRRDSFRRNRHFSDRKYKDHVIIYVYIQTAFYIFVQSGIYECTVSSRIFRIIFLQ